MKTFFVPAAAFLVVATATIAQPAADTNSSDGDRSGATKTNDKGERLVCRWVNDADVGSLVQGRTRRCLTAEQWRAIRR